MKPIVIIAVERDGGVLITKEELQKLIDDAYEQGKIDGKNMWATPSPITTTPYPTWKAPEITCTNTTARNNYD